MAIRPLEELDRLPQTTIYPVVDGELLIKQIDDSLAFLWRGGPRIMISMGLVMAADERYIKIQGDIITIGPYTAKIVERCRPLNLLVAERLGNNGNPSA